MIRITFSIQPNIDCSISLVFFESLGEMLFNSFFDGVNKNTYS